MLSRLAPSRPVAPQLARVHLESSPHPDPPSPYLERRRLVGIVRPNAPTFPRKASPCSCQRQQVVSGQWSAKVQNAKSQPHFQLGLSPSTQLQHRSLPKKNPVNPVNPTILLILSKRAAPSPARPFTIRSARRIIPPPPLPTSRAGFPTRAQAPSRRSPPPHLQPGGPGNPETSWQEDADAR